LVDNADWPRNTLTGYGQVALRFYVDGVGSPAPPVYVANNSSMSSGVSYAMSNFVQNFVVKSNAKINEIGIRMGNNQNPFNVELIAKVNGVVAFDQKYSGCHQRTSDWMTVFPVQCDRVFAVGEKVELSVANSTSVGMEPIMVDNADWPRNTLTGYGSVALRFYVMGSAATPAPMPVPAPAPTPTPTPTPTPSPTPAAPHYLANNSSLSSGVSYALSSFVQNFVVKSAGKCTEIGIRMGNNQNPYNTSLTAKVGGAVAFDLQFQGCHQRTTDWMTVFAVKCDRTFAVGEKVELTVSTSTAVGMEPIMADNADWPRSNLSGYGLVALRFYALGTA